MMVDDNGNEDVVSTVFCLHVAQPDNKKKS